MKKFSLVNLMRLAEASGLNTENFPDYVLNADGCEVDAHWIVVTDWGFPVFAAAPEWVVDEKDFVPYNKDEIFETVTKLVFTSAAFCRAHGWRRLPDSMRRGTNWVELCEGKEVTEDGYIICGEGMTSFSIDKAWIEPKTFTVRRKAPETAPTARPSRERV